MTEACKEDKIELVKIPFIHYPIKYKKDQIWALIDSGNKVNTMNFAYAAQLGLKVQKTNIEI